MLSYTLSSNYKRAFEHIKAFAPPGIDSAQLLREMMVS
jgi:hypothetical protein